MNHDLHWYVLSDFRNKGYLSGAMRNTILFHLFLDREEQKITIDNKHLADEEFKKSEYLALALGFVQDKDNEYILTSKKYQTEDIIEGENSPITEERLHEIRKEINFLARSLWMIQTEIDIKFGDAEYAEELKELVDEIKKHTWRLEDIWHESKERETY